MSNHSDHDFIAELKEYIHDDSDDLAFETARVNFAAYDQMSRTQLLRETEKLVGAEDDAGLRQKAQLMSLHRELRHLDSQMRAAGR